MEMAWQVDNKPVGLLCVCFGRQLLTFERTGRVCDSGQGRRSCLQCGVGFVDLAVNDLGQPTCLDDDALDHLQPDEPLGVVTKCREEGKYPR
jgi:hypothetical protein